MTEDKIAKIQEVLSKDDVAVALANAETPEAAIAVLNENGVDVTIEEFEKFMESQPEISDELDENALEDVAGGWANKVLEKGLPLVTKLWKCNQYTNWGRNGKKCICGVHTTVRKGLRL